MVEFNFIRYDEMKAYVDEEEFDKSVTKNGGFYIARYEAGSTTYYNNHDDYTAEYITETYGTPVFQKGKYPCDVSIVQAKDLAKSIYSDTKFTVCLVPTSAWYRTLGWLIETGDKSLCEIHKDSGNWGNYKDAEFTITTGKYSLTFDYTQVNGSFLKENGMKYKLTTGATDRNCAKNIYDLAGNMGKIIYTTSNDIDLYDVVGRRLHE